jgi:cation diffusion facilitator family transporter
MVERLGAIGVVADALEAASMTQAVVDADPDVVVDVLTAVPAGGAWHPEDMEATNELRVRGTRNLMDAARGCGVRRYVAESSYLIYGSVDPGHGPVSEDRPLATRSLAGPLGPSLDALAKKERLVLEASRRTGLEGIVLRFGNTYGPGAGLQSIVADLRSGRFPVERRPGDGIPWIHVDEAADAIVAAVERGRPGAAYNVAEDEPMSFAAFVRCLASATEAPQPHHVPDWVLQVVAPYAKAALIDARLLLSSQKAKAELAWAPRFGSPRDGLAASVAAQDWSAAPSKSSDGGAGATTVLVALSTNVVMTVGKAFAALLTGSPALLAETLHSLADTANEILLYIGQRSTSRSPDIRHPLGYGSELFFWALLAALGTFLTGGVLSIWEGIQHLLSPEATTNFVIGYVILGVGFVVDGTSWVVAVRQLWHESRLRQVRLLEHVRGTTDTTVTAVFFEDGASLLGGGIAMLGLAAHQVFGSEVPDAVAAIAIGLLLCAIGVRHVSRNRDLLTNLSDSPRVVDRIRDLLSADRSVAQVGTVTTFYAGPHELVVLGQIQPIDELSGMQVRQLLETLTKRVAESVPRAVAVYLVPVVTATASPAVTAFDIDYWIRRDPAPEQS